MSKFSNIGDIGVPDGMAPEDSKYIRMLNWIVFVVLLGWFMLFLGMMGGSLLMDWPWFITIATCIMVFSTALTFVFNGKKLYTLARNYMMIMLITGTFFYCLALGLNFATHFILMVLAGTATLYPKGERKWIVLIIFMCFAIFTFLYMGFEFGYLEPLYTKPINPKLVWLGRTVTYYNIGLGFVAITWISHTGAIKAETQLKDEKQKVTNLIEKLKVYLPHQFVESITRGDRGAEPDYKRKKLTVFFSDVKGFTAWTDRLEPEDTQEILNQYLTEMSDIARKWGGTIDKFIGDAIMIFFGDPEFTNDRDHALRCVKMAMEMQEKMFSLRKEWEDLGHEEPLHIRIGINTGYSTVGNFGSKDRLNYTILGSNVNLASRLEAACEPDKITISHTTYSLIKNEIDCKPKGEIEVKGFSEPVKIYEVKCTGWKPSWD